jgi:hypothetical protein
LANKQPETAAPRAGIYWRYVDSFEFFARDLQTATKNCAKGKLYWRYVDTFAHFGEGLTNSQKHLRQGRNFTCDMLTLFAHFGKGLANYPAKYL